jgi:hypothetical protein
MVKILAVSLAVNSRQNVIANVLNVGQKIIRLNYYHEVIKTQIQIAAFST